jgi:hypothetical protein
MALDIAQHLQGVGKLGSFRCLGARQLSLYRRLPNPAGPPDRAMASFIPPSSEKASGILDQIAKECKAFGPDLDLILNRRV